MSVEFAGNDFSAMQNLESEFMAMQPDEESDLIADSSLFTSFTGNARQSTLKPEALERAIRDVAVPVPTSLTYTLGLLLTAMTMVLLLASYLAIIAAAGWLVYYHVVNNYTAISAILPTPIALTCYSIPIFTGVILIVFMIKPLAASPGKIIDSVPLDEKEEHTLFYFIKMICRELKAPFPVRIELDSEINASASFAGGYQSMLRRELVLRIGLPLLAGLTVTQLASVLAHEFGHFAQGWGMRLSYLIRGINIWFHRVVYERDSWDLYWEKVQDESDQRLAFVFWFIKLMARLVRKILWILMHIGQLTSCFMLRRMEFNADLYAIEFAGSQAFIEHKCQVLLLNMAQRGVESDLREAYRENRLVDDYPTMLTEKVPEIPEDQATVFIELLQKHSDGFFSTHPTDAARNFVAFQMERKGMFSLEKPARQLIENYDHLTRIVTVLYYAHDHGLSVSGANLVPTQEITDRNQEILDVLETGSRYFHQVFNHLNPPIFKNVALKRPADFNKISNRLLEARKIFKRSAIHARHFLTLLHEQAEYARQVSMLTALVNAGFDFSPGDFQLNLNGASNLQSALAEADEEVTSTRDQLDGLTLYARERLYFALQMLYNPRVAKAMGENYVPVERVERLYYCMAHMGQELHFVWSLTRQLNEFMAIISQVEGNEGNLSLHQDLDRRAAEMQRKLQLLINVFSRDAYPFEHSDENVNLVQYLCQGSTGYGAEIIRRSEQFIQNYWTLYQRLIATLAQIGENVETALGLPSITMRESPELELVTRR